MPYKRKCSIKLQRGAATTDAEGLITVSSPLTINIRPQVPQFTVHKFGRIKHFHYLPSSSLHRSGLGAFLSPRGYSHIPQGMGTGFSLCLAPRAPHPLICKGLQSRVRLGCTNTRPGIVPQVLQPGRGLLPLIAAGSSGVAGG